MIINATKLIAVTSLTTALAAQSFSTADPSDQAERQSDRVQDREKEPDQQRDRMRPKRTAEDEKRYWHDYFGGDLEESTPMSGLLQLTGPFKIEATFYGGPGEEVDEPMRTTGFAERRAGLGGAVVVERYTFEGGPDALPLTHDSPLARQKSDARAWELRRQASLEKGPRKGVVLWGFDPGAEEYTVAWSGSNSSAVRFDKGELDDDGRLVLTSEYIEPESGERYQTRSVLEITSPDRQKLTMYADGGFFETERKIYEIAYTRDHDFNGFATAMASDRQDRDQTQRRDDRYRDRD